MIFNEIYVSALALLGEDPSGVYSDDYAARAPYLIPILCYNLSHLDRKCRSDENSGGINYMPSAPVDMHSDFPLSDMLATPAAYYLASMLVFDSDETRSDTLYERFCEMCDGIESSLPCKLEKTVDKYPV